MGNRKNLRVEVGTILVFSLGLFTLVSVLSFHGADPAFLGAGTVAPHNACGRIGASLASMVLNCFGMGSFLFPAALFIIASTIHRQEGGVSVIRTLGGMAVAVSSLTVFLGLQWKNWNFGGATLLTGGAFGTWVGESLVHQLNVFGASLVAFVVFSLALVLTTPVQIAAWSAKLIRASFLIVFRLGKLLLTYAAYWIGVLLAKFAHSTAQNMQNMLRKASKSKWAKAPPVAASSEKMPVAIPVGFKTDETASLAKFGHKAEGKVEGREDPDLSKVGEMPIETEPFVGVSGGTNTGAAQELVFNLDGMQISDEMGDDGSSIAPGKKPNLPSNANMKGQGIAILPREVDPALKNAVKAPKPVLRAKKGNWQIPTVEFLKNPPKVESSIDRERLIANSQILKQKFADFGIDGEVTAVRPGPVITLYEFKPGPGVKVSRIAALSDDLSMALSAQSVRILAPLPGKAVVGIEIPSDTRETVYLREFLQHPDFYGTKHSIPVVMGKDIGGQTYLSDLARMPHLLCAGQTGSGKSVFMNGLICSLFYRFTPDELRMILVDPKFIEFRSYQDIPHLLLPVVDDPKQASIALRWAVREMERRYRILAKLGSRNLAAFNQKVEELGADVVKDLLFSEEQSAESAAAVSGGDWIEAFEPDESGAPRVSKLPYIVIIIDELADLMMIAKKEVEISIARIAQKARAAGIHLIIATQRPSTDVITGLIKANLPSRVSFQLASYVDSKTILDRAGAERLLGQGDMLFIPPGISQNIRLHGAYLDDDEINKITSFLKSQGKPMYRDEILLSDEDENGDESEEGSESEDELFQEGVELVKRSGHASASFLQRHLKIGYNRAARMIETMEGRGIVGPQDGARPREVLVR